MTAPARGRAVLEVLGAAGLFGTTGTAQALGPTGTTPMGVGAARLVVGGAGLLAVLPRLGGDPRRALGLWRTPLGLFGGLCTALYQVAFFAGVSRAGIALGTLVTIGSAPFLTGALAAVLMRQRPAAAWLASTAVAVAGLALLALDGVSRPGVDPVGLLLALGSGAAYAVYTVTSRMLIDSGRDSTEVMAGAFSLGGLLLVPVLLTQPLGWIATPSGLVMAAYLGIVATTVAYVLFGRGLRALPPGTVTTLVLAEPLVATLLGITMFGERLGLLGWTGFAVVLVALLLQGLSEVRRPAEVPAR